MRVYEVVHRDSGKTYIGATTRPLDERIARHFSAAFADRHNGIFYDGLRAHGIQAFTWRVIVECATEAEMWDAERRLIVERNCRTPHGYNQTAGGRGGGWELGRKRGPMSEADRLKRSLAQKGREAWNKGIPHTYAAREKMRGRQTWNKGIPRTESDKAKIRAAMVASDRHGDKHPKCKPIECDGTTYPSVRDMERRTGLCRSTIYTRLSKGRARFV